MKDKIEKLIKLVTGETYRDLKNEITWARETIVSKEGEIDHYKGLVEHACNERDEVLCEFNKAMVDCEKKKKDIEALESELERINTSYKDDIQDYQCQIAHLNKDVSDLHKKVNEKETQRRSAVGKYASAQKEICKLQHQVEFWKNHRRTPDIEEIKDYELRRVKRSKKKENNVA